jgi:hypothetical protein
VGSLRAINVERCSNAPFHQRMQAGCYLFPTNSAGIPSIRSITLLPVAVRFRLAEIESSRSFHARVLPQALGEQVQEAHDHSALNFVSPERLFPSAEEQQWPKWLRRFRRATRLGGNHRPIPGHRTPRKPKRTSGCASPVRTRPAWRSQRPVQKSSGASLGCDQLGSFARLIHLPQMHGQAVPSILSSPTHANNRTTP